MRTNRRRFRPQVAGALLTWLVLPIQARSEGGSNTETPVVVGSRIRVTAPTAFQGRVEGTVMEMDASSVLVSTDDHQPLRVPQKAVTQLEVSTGRHRNAGKGLLIGAASGTALFALIPPCAGSEAEQPCPTKAQMVGIGAVGGAAWGALIGALIKSDRWTSAPLAPTRLSLAPTRGRGVKASLTVAW